MKEAFPSFAALENGLYLVDCISVAAGLFLCIGYIFVPLDLEVLRNAVRNARTVNFFAH